jgi:CHAT domain-containing protein
MINDFIVQIVPADGDNLRFYLTANSPPLKRKRLPRKRFALSADDMDTLRRGEPAPTLTQNVAAALSGWLVGGEVTGWLDAALKSRTEESVRLVLEVDDDLLPTLADLPVELLHFQGDWLALQPRVSGIVHQLTKSVGSELPPGSRQYPLRVLVVRSNPADLGSAVPDAGSICNDIVKVSAERGPNTVEVDLLSREVGALDPAPAADPWPDFRRHLQQRDIRRIDPPTWQNFRESLKKTHYDILVYLGHGDLPDPEGDAVPMGRLEFESPDGSMRDSVSAEQLKYQLQQPNRAVPVILLAGCLTAAQFMALDPAAQAEITKRIPKMMRGSQGVAQMLVSSEAGVHFAVGMRYKLETRLAVVFLRAFFRSLLKDKRGHVEEAVRAGRNELMAVTGAHPPTWSAPVVFRTVGNEPMFDFLARAPLSGLTDEEKRDQEYRERTWTLLVAQPGLPLAHQVLDETEAKMRARALQHGAVLVVDRVELVSSGLQPRRIPVRVYGTLAVQTLTATLTASSENVMMTNIRSTAALKASGYRLLDISEGGTPALTFSLKWTANGDPAPLPEGPLVEVQFDVNDTIAASYLVSLQVETQPSAAVRTINNTIILALQ